MLLFLQRFHSPSSLSFQTPLPSDVPPLTQSAVNPHPRLLPHLTFPPCPLSCCPQLKPAPHRTFLLSHPARLILSELRRTYICLRGGTLSTGGSKVMFLPLGLKPKASAGVLQRTATEALAELQRWHFPTPVPGLATAPPPAPEPLGICEDKD